MSKNKLFAFLFAALLSSPSMAAPLVAVIVRAEPVGADIVYHYTLMRSGSEVIGELTIGVRPSGYGCETIPVKNIVVCAGNYFGTLVTMPIGTTWAPDPYFNNLRETPTLSAGATTQPAPWAARASGLRALGGASYEGPGTVGWKLPWNLLDPEIYTYVQQPVYEFSVRVPAGPGSTAEYMNGLFAVEFAYDGYSQSYHAPIATSLAAPQAPALIRIPVTERVAVPFSISWPQPSAGTPVTYYILEEQQGSNTGGCQPCRPGRICTLQCVPPNQRWSMIYTGPNQQYNVAGKTAPGTFYYRVSACNSAGCSPPMTGTQGLVVTP
jgi:hypothetical protein